MKNIKTIWYALLGLICLTLTAGKYGSIPTDGYIRISIINSKDKNELTEPSSDYYFEGYTYSKNQNGDLVLRIPEIDSYPNHDKYVELRDWIEQTEENKGMDLCRDIKTIANREYDWIPDICFIFKNASMITNEPVQKEEYHNKKLYPSKTIVCYR